MVVMILGILILIAGIVLLIVRKKKVPGAVLIAAGLLAAVIGFLWVGTEGDEDDSDTDTKTETVTDSFVDVPVMDGIKADEDKITFDAHYVSISIEPDDAGKDLAPGESPAALHSGDTVEGVTEDGIAWSTDKADGTGTIHMNVNGKPVSATVKPKTDEKSGSKDKTDAGQAAAAVAALVNTGYKKGVDNYNHDYSIWYSEPAQCLVYYPAQLKLSAAYEDNSVVFSDSRSKAKLKISLEENDFACMDDVESFIANTDYNKVLATGTDWYSAETVGKTMTEYSVTGLGQKHSVNATLTYENQYDFVFRELRTLIKCRFIEDGKWVSNEVRDTVGQISPLFALPYEDGMTWKLTSWFFDNWTCYLIYPDVFTKAYRGEDNEEYFTDPKTGAYIHVYRRSFSGHLQDVIDYYDLRDYDISGENSVRGYYNITGYRVNHFIILRDGYEYHATMYAPDAYAHLYEQGASAMQLTLPGDEISSIEMQDIFFPQYRCYVTVPLQFAAIGQSGTEYNFRDRFNGLDLKVTFTDVTADTDTGNIFDMFNVVADDQNLSIGNNVVKWHSQDGLFIAALGDHHAGMLQMDYPNAQTAYEKSWTRFNMRFDDSAKAETIADRIEQDIKVAKIEEETEQAKQDIAVASGKDKDNGKDKDETPTSGPAGTDSDPGQKPSDAPAVSEAPAVTPAIIAQPVNNTLPANNDWMYDEQQNVVLWYKDYEDYRNISLTADSWFKSEALGFSRSHFFKWGTLEVINSVLRYNEYEVDVDKDWLQYDAVAKLNIMLEDRLDDPQAGSQLGDGIVSVFEAYCEVLGIEVPDYVSNAREPEIEPAEPTAAPRPTQAPAPTAVPDDPSQGEGEPYIPDTGLSDEDKALLEKIGGFWKYEDPGNAQVSFHLSETGNWIRWVYDDYGDNTETAGSILIADDGSIILCDFDLKEILYKLVYEEDMDSFYDSEYADFLVRDCINDPEEYYEDHPAPLPTGDGYTMLHPEYRDAFLIISKRYGRETIFEELAAAMGIADFGTPAYEFYGGVNFVDIGRADTSAFQRRLKEMGLRLSGEDDSEGHAVGYYGILSGYEYLNEIHVTIWELSDHTEITWILTDGFTENDGIPGGLSLALLPFSESDYGYGDVYRDVRGTSRFGHIMREMYDGAKKLAASSNGFGTGKGIRDFVYVCGFGTSLDDDDVWSHAYSLKNLDEIIEKYNIPGYDNATIDDSALPFYNALIHEMMITLDSHAPFTTLGLLWYIPGAGVCYAQDGELVFIK
jgi:hypothetical protein